MDDNDEFPDYFPVVGMKEDHPSFKKYTILEFITLRSTFEVTILKGTSVTFPTGKGNVWKVISTF